MIYKFKPYEPTPLQIGHLPMGDETFGVTNKYFTKNDKPWIGVMGEFHFSRYDRREWRRELAKMKAGGITAVSTYLFWIHHEEIEGQIDFSGDRDVRHFVLAAQRAGLDVVLRIGPWAHGECRNGGFPDWLQHKPYPLRQNSPEYLAQVRHWYTAIYEQVCDLFYKDDGPIVGVQIENELPNDANHLLTLTLMAREIGYDVPLITVTGWNNRFGARIPLEEVFPVFGAYCDAPWDSHIQKRPPSSHYVFNPNRNTDDIGNDLILPVDEDGWSLPYHRYPFATCELGAGLQVTHHRRPVVSGMDAYAMSLTKLGSGNNLVGYYMYHGGTNPIGKLSTFQESKATGYPNDLPIRSYDFHTALGEYGQPRDQYGLLNMLHMFLAEWGADLAPMEYVASPQAVQPSDTRSLRYCMRTNGESGFVFINHYQRLLPLEDVLDVVIKTPQVTFPAMDIKGDVSFFLPFNMNLAGNRLIWATAQPLCRVDDTYYFAAIPGIEPQYKWAQQPENIRIITLSWEDARRARKLAGKLYFGNVYEMDGQILNMDEDYQLTDVTITPLSQPPFDPPYGEELAFNGPRALNWYQLHVDSATGMIAIPGPYDVGQIYADGQLVADQFYHGEDWLVPARLLWGKTAYLVTSEIKNDFYREF